MKALLSSLILTISIQAFAKDNRVLIPPFENLSSRRAPTEYLISAGGLSERVPTHNVVDRFSHIPREILEDIVSQIKGVRPVERQRLDQFFLENGLGASQTFVDGEKAKSAMIQLKTPTAVQGTILDVFEERSDYNGYVSIRTTRWTARVRVRIYNLVGGSLQIPYSKILVGKRMSVDTPTTKQAGPDEETALAVLGDALEQLRTDEGFNAAVRAGAPETDPAEADDELLKIPFDVAPEGADVYVDDAWEGKTPCIVRLKADKQVVVRIEKRPTYESWQAKITPRPGFRVSRELELSTPSKEKGTK